MPLRLGPDLVQYDERLLKASAYVVELGLVTQESRETRVGGRGHLHALLGGLTSGDLPEVQAAWPYGRTDIQPYRPGGRASQYIFKQKPP